MILLMLAFDNKSKKDGVICQQKFPARSGKIIFLAKKAIV